MSQFSGRRGHSGACPPAVCAQTSGRSVRTRSSHRPLLCSLTASWHLWASRGAEGAAEMGRGMEGRGRAGGHGGGAGAEPAGEKEALQFGLVFVESALAPGGERPRLAPALALGCHRRPRWRWTGRHLAAPPGPGRAGGLCAGSAHG